MWMRSLVGLCVAVLSCTSVVAGQAQTPSSAMTAAELEKKMAAAVGREPHSERERWTITYADGIGKETYVRRGEEFADDETRGGLSERRGRIGEQRWAQNENGLTRTWDPTPTELGADRSSADASGFDADHTDATLVRVSAPVDAWELRYKGTAGETSTVDVDPATFLVLRRTRRFGNQPPRVTTYADYRTVGGVTRAHRLTYANGAKVDDQSWSLDGYDANVAVTDADLAIPRSRACPFVFPENAKRISLPARMVGLRVYVRMTIDGRGYDFQVDTGAGASYITEDVANRLQLSTKYATTQTINSRYVTRTVVVPKMALGDIAVNDLVMHTTPPDDPDGEVASAGLIGYDLLSCVDLRFDYDDKTVDAEDPARLEFPPTGVVTALAANLRYAVPMVTASVDGDPGSEFVLDTGADQTLFFSHFADRHAAALRRENGGGGYAQAVGGGLTEIERIAVPRFSFGGVRFNNVVFMRAREANAFNSTDIDGLIGQEMIASFIVTTDYPNNRVILEPGKVLRQYARKLSLTPSRDPGGR
jgi:hypothetical protein